MFKLISFLCKCIFGGKPPTVKSIEDIKAIVDKAIKDKYPPLIDTIEEQKDLRIAQKYLDQLISDKGLKLSFDAYLSGILGFMLAIFAIGITYILTGQSLSATTILSNQTSIIDVGTALVNKGLTIVIYAIIPGSIVIFLIDRKNKKIEKEIKFMQYLVLKIEGRLEK